MKKFIVVLMALLFAGSAFAQDAPKGAEFKYGVWANAFAITHQFAAKDTSEDYSAIRVRPQFTASMENASVVTRLEIDQYYGSGAEAKNTNCAPDSDSLAVEVKWAYINVKDMLVPGLSMTAGIAPYVYSVGYNNDMPQFNLVYDAGMVKVDLAYVKSAENSKNSEAAGVKNKDDAQMYSAKLPIKAGDITITPAVLYAKGEKNNPAGTFSAAFLADTGITDADFTVLGNTAEFTKTMPSIAVALTSGALSLNADFVYIKGENKTFDVDYKAYAGYLNVGFKVDDSLSLNVFGIYTTGQDDSEDLTSFNAVCGDEVEIGPLFIINDGGNINQVGVGADEFDKANDGLMVGGLAVNYKMDKLSALAQVAYAQTTSDELTKDKDLGIEVDLRLAYEVAPKTSLWAEGAMLMAGKYVETKNGGDNSDPMYYAAGLMTNF